MRRAIGITLAGLGAFLLVVAVMLPAYVAGQVVKYPLNEYLVTQNIGHNVSYFSATKAQPIAGATMTVTGTIKQAPGGSSSTAVWDEFSYLYDTSNHLTYAYNTRQFAFDRRTAQLVNCCGDNLNGNPSVPQTGLVGFLWPFGTQPVTYSIFDETLGKAATARYAGTSTIDGITVYRFVEKIAPTKVGFQTLPASIVGMKGTGEVTLPEVYTANNTFYVDPDTGAQLNQVQKPRLILTDSSGTQRLLLLNASFTFTPQSLSKVVSIDQSARSKISLLTLVLPIIAAVVGLAALIGGILLARPRRGDQPRFEDTAATTPALGPAG